MAADWINDVFDNDKQDEKKDDWFNEVLNAADQTSVAVDLEYFDFGYFLCESRIGMPVTKPLKDVSLWPDPIEANDNRLAIWNATSTKLINGELNSILKQQVEELLSFKNTKYLKRNSLSANIHHNTTIYDVINPFANINYILPSVINSQFNYIPALFYCRKDKHTKQWNVRIQSEINDLPKVYFKNLYKTIEQIFSKFVPLFVDVLSMIDTYQDYCGIGATPEQTARRKQFPGKSEYQFKVITKIQIYELNKHSIYEGKYHIEGGDVYNIGAVGLYYFDISDNVTGGELKICRSNKFKQRAICAMLESKIEVNDQQCLVFSNRVLTHKVGQMQLKLNGNVKDEVGYRKFISFFVVDPALDVENIKCSDEIIVNIRSKVWYIITYWKREHCSNMQIAKSLCMLVEAFVCGDMDYNKQMIDQTRAMFLKDNFMQTNRIPMAD